MTRFLRDLAIALIGGSLLGLLASAFTSPRAGLVVGMIAGVVLLGAVVLWEQLPRYRIWQANRTDVLYPENQLPPRSEPESEQKSEPEKRVVVDVTPEFLVGLFKDRLAIQGQKLADGFLGKWMPISGPIGNVSPWSSGSSQVTLNRAGADAATVYLYFHDESVVERLSMLKHGDRIIVSGRIDRIQFDHVQLDPCELVDVVTTPMRDQLGIARAKGAEILAEEIDPDDDTAVSGWQGRHESWRSETFDWLRRDVRIEDAHSFVDVPEFSTAAIEMRLVETFGSMLNAYRASLKHELANLATLIERSRND